MKLDQRRKFILQFLILTVILLSACSGPRTTADQIQITIVADGEEVSAYVPSGSTVQKAIESSGISLGAIDRVEPPGYTLLDDGSTIVITRISERFEIEEIDIPFERQTLRNEALPIGESRLLQPGENGLQEITYRILEEEGVEISRTPIKNSILVEPVPEIIMVGIQAAYTPVAIEGKLAYLSGQNAWIVQSDTGNRRPLVLSGDLDGYIFELSDDGRFLLFTRQVVDDEETINRLWAISTTDASAEPIDLKVENVIHFADWMPGIDSRIVAFSTVEPSQAAPGWQANNNLLTVRFTESGVVFRPETVIDSNAGGQYGWWGTTFIWGEDRLHLAYARADSIGFVDFDTASLVSAIEITPYQTLSDWAWVPGLTWGRDNRTIFFIDHGDPIALENPDASPVFDLIALTGQGGLQLPLAEKTGMFAYPTSSPTTLLHNGEIEYRLAFLQAISPLESDTSNYRLTVMDRDGSNLRSIFPPVGESGLEPQPVVWSPGADQIAVIYRGDLWIVDIVSELGQRITAEGLTLTMDWSP
jgi:hypothetical protein